jgi:hypothetical protein
VVLSVVVVVVVVVGGAGGGSCICDHFPASLLHCCSVFLKNII